MYHPIDKRRLVISEKNKGKTLIEISTEQGISYSTTKRIWQSYRQLGDKGIELKYQNCGLSQPKYYLIYRLSTWLKRRYPDWGAPYILTILRDRYPAEKFPTTRTLQNWFRVKAMNKTHMKRDMQKIEEVLHVHDCWQIDAREKIELADQTKACYLTTVDVKSGAVLEAPIFPQCQYQPSNIFTGARVSDQRVPTLGQTQKHQSR